MKKHFRVTEPSITNKEINYVTKAVTFAWGANAYVYISEFERKFAGYIGVAYAIATSSCTGAIHLSLAALGVGLGDEVIIPDITWAATAFAIRYVQATPVFVDILPDTWCIDPEKIEQAITKKTKAIIPVHLYGNSAEMEAISALGEKYGIPVIEDAAESVGTEYQGRKTGSMGSFSCFSFHGTKTLTTGEGGILLTNNRNHYEKALFLSNAAKSKEKLFWNLDIGLKYKMTDMQAALGLAQLSRIKTLLKHKVNIYNWYREFLGSNGKITLNTTRPYTKNSYWMPTVVWEPTPGLTKETVMKQLSSYGIDPRPFFYPLSQMPPFKTTVKNPVAYDISSRGINLPCGYSLTKSDIRYISGCVLKILSSQPVRTSRR